MNAPEESVFENLGFKIVGLVLVFILVYTAFNSVIVLRFGGLLGLGTKFLYTWIVLVSLSLPVSMLAERVYPNIVSRIIYTASTLWMGVLLFLVCSLLIYEVVNFFYPIPSAGILIGGFVGLISIFSVVNARGLDMKELELSVDGLEAEVSVVQLTDLHLGTIRNSAFLEKVVEKALSLDPDVVMITGDLIEASARINEEMFDEFERFDAPVYFVTGNHEVYEGVDEAYSTLENTTIQVLRNETVDYEGLQIVGVEYSEDEGRLGEELENLQIEEGRPSVLMYHSPEGVEDAKRAGIDLQLAGHTHGGQVFPFNFAVRIMFKYIRGLYDLGGMFLYVSPGTGTWGPYMRLGSRNEVTGFTLKGK